MKITCPYCTKEINPETTQCSSCGTSYGSDTLRLLRSLVKKAMENEISERRKLDRVPKKFRIVYPTPKALIENYLSNISQDGMFIETENPMNRGDRFDLKLFLPDKGKELELLCEVIWSHKEGQVGPEKNFLQEWE